jgi:hypothetical protein
MNLLHLTKHSAMHARSLFNCQRGSIEIGSAFFESRMQLPKNLCEISLFSIIAAVRSVQHSHFRAYCAEHIFAVGNA